MRYYGCSPEFFATRPSLHIPPQFSSLIAIRLADLYKYVPLQINDRNQP